ncbi:hypothetical protein RZS08_41805, partial [Arthrospira platensis SPKY1]|nr:hypothetical protein [Arthrospira platensis SPKY1]
PAFLNPDRVLRGVGQRHRAQYLVLASGQSGQHGQTFIPVAGLAENHGVHHDRRIRAQHRTRLTPAQGPPAGSRLGQRQPGDVVAGRLAGQRGLVHFDGQSAIGDADLAQQFPATR